MATLPRRSMLTGALAGLLSPLLLRGDPADARPHRRRPRRPPTIRLVVQVQVEPIDFRDPTRRRLSYLLTSLETQDIVGPSLDLTMSAGEVHAALVADAIAVAAEVFGILDITDEEVLVLGGPLAQTGPS